MRGAADALADSSSSSSSYVWRCCVQMHIAAQSCTHALRDAGAASKAAATAAAVEALRSVMSRCITDTLAAAQLHGRCGGGGGSVFVGRHAS